MKAIIDIDIVHRDGLYFYNRRKNGRVVINGERIDRGRAQQIYEANRDQPQQRTKGIVNFDAAGYEWSWTVHLEIEEEAHVTTD